MPYESFALHFVFRICQRFRNFISDTAKPRQLPPARADSMPAFKAASCLLCNTTNEFNTSLMLSTCALPVWLYYLFRHRKIWFKTWRNRSPVCWANKRLFSQKTTPTDSVASTANMNISATQSDTRKAVWELQLPLLKTYLLGCLIKLAKISSTHSCSLSDARAEAVAPLLFKR